MANKGQVGAAGLLDDLAEMTAGKKRHTNDYSRDLMVELMRAANAVDKLRGERARAYSTKR